MHWSLDPSDERWTTFIASKPQANIFHHPAWINLMAECYGYHPFVVVVCDASGEIRAGLPIMELKSALTGRRWVSLPFTDHCVPIYSDVECLNELIEVLVSLAKDSNIPRLELRWAPSSRSDMRTDSHHVLHSLNLDLHPELVASRFHQMHRRNVEVAKKRGVRIECGRTRDSLDKFYQLHLSTRRRQGTPIQPRKYFDLLGKMIIDKGLGFVLTAYKDDECLAAAVFLHWQQTLTYKYGASAEQGLNLRPNNLLFWKAIEWGCEHGYAVFDMGRTDLENTGLRQFKTRWGAEEQPLTYATYSATPQHTEDGRLKSLMQSVIQHSPPWICRAAGELLYRHFG